MPSTNDIRNTLSDPKPLYFAAGVIDKIREEAPDRIAAVRATDPKEVQARFTKQAKETQAKVTETLGTIDTDIKRLREQAQSLALQGVGVAAEYAVKAREAYDELADRGRGAVKNWRGEDSDAPEVTVEREPVKVAQPPAEPRGGTQAGKGSTGSAGSTGAGSTGGAAGTAGKAGGPAQTGATEQTGQGSAGSASASAAKKSTAARKTTTARTSTPKSNSTKPGTAKSNGNGKQPPKSGA